MKSGAGDQIDFESQVVHKWVALFNNKLTTRKILCLVILHQCSFFDVNSPLLD